MFKIGAIFILLAVSTTSYAADIFEDGKARDIAFATPLQASDTLGGYALYPGEGKWLFEKTNSTQSTGPSTIVLGSVLAKQDEAGTLFARLYVTANLNQGEGRSWSGTPCGPEHLIARNKPRGREDNCMTIDPAVLAVGEKQVTMLSIRITNTAGSGRYYTTLLQLNPALLGFRDTGLGDWNAEYIKTQPFKQAFLAKLTAWAEKLQDATNVAFSYNKPQDAFKDVPSWRELLPVPEALAQQKHSWGFLSAAEDIKNKKGYSALAFSPQGDYKTRWGNAWAQGSQELADKVALANCENGRAPSSPVCTLYATAKP